MMATPRCIIKQILIVSRLFHHLRIQHGSPLILFPKIRVQTHDSSKRMWGPVGARARERVEYVGGWEEG